MKRPRQAARYRICVEGRLGEDWSGWFSGMSLSCEDGTDGQAVTTLEGEMPDQPALRGILSRIWDMGLTVISVNRTDAQVGQSQEVNHDDEDRRAEE